MELAKQWSCPFLPPWSYYRIHGGLCHMRLLFVLHWTDPLSAAVR